MLGWFLKAQEVVVIYRHMYKLRSMAGVSNAARSNRDHNHVRLGKRSCEEIFDTKVTKSN